MHQNVSQSLIFYQNSFHIIVPKLLSIVVSVIIKSLEILKEMNTLFITLFILWLKLRQKMETVNIVFHYFFELNIIFVLHFV
jgi:hypothetical protein